MYLRSTLFLLLTISLLHGNEGPLSHSKNSPYTKLGVLVEDMDSVKKEIEELKEEMILLKAENENLKRQLVGQSRTYKKQSTSFERNRQSNTNRENTDSKKVIQDLQKQLQNLESKISEICQETKNNLQQFSKQTENNIVDNTRNNLIQHTIVSGESLASIARRYRTTTDQILSANHLKDTNNLYVGDTLLIPQESF